MERAVEQSEERVMRELRAELNGVHERLYKMSETFAKLEQLGELRMRVSLANQDVPTSHNYDPDTQQFPRPMHISLVQSPQSQSCTMASEVSSSEPQWSALRPEPHHEPPRLVAEPNDGTREDNVMKCALPVSQTNLGCDFGSCTASFDKQGETGYPDWVFISDLSAQHQLAESPLDVNICLAENATRSRVAKEIMRRLEQCGQREGSLQSDMQSIGEDMVENPVQHLQLSDTTVHDLPSHASAILGHASVHSGTFAARLATNDEVIEESSPESQEPAALANHHRSRIPVAWRTRQIIDTGNTTAAKVSTRSTPQVQTHASEVGGAREVSSLESRARTLQSGNSGNRTGQVPVSQTGTPLQASTDRSERSLPHFATSTEAWVSRYPDWTELSPFQVLRSKASSMIAGVMENVWMDTALPESTKGARNFLPHLPQAPRHGN